MQTTKKKVVKNNFKISELKASNRVDLPLLIVILILVALGLVMILSASSPSALAETGDDSYFYFNKQAIATVLGFIGMFFLSKINYDIYKKFYKIIYIISVLILFTVLIPKIGVESSGARRWINLGMQIQPSEITKIGLIIWVAGYYSDPKNKIQGFWGSFLKPIVAVLIPIAILYFVQNHLSAGIIIALVTAVMIIMSGCQLRYIAYALGAGVAGILAMIPLIQSKLAGEGGGSFRSDRIEAWLDPWKNPVGTSYQTIQGLYAIGSGGLFGVGLGESKQKYLYIPEAHNDFIFAIIAEELGFIGCTVVLGLFAVLIVRGIVIAIRAKDTFGSLIAIGITALIATQVILNIAVVTNSIPNTGISLPFLSYGGSSIVILLGAMGVLLNISRSAKKI